MGIWRSQSRFGPVNWQIRSWTKWKKKFGILRGWTSERRTSSMRWEKLSLSPSSSTATTRLSLLSPPSLSLLHLFLARGISLAREISSTRESLRRRRSMILAWVLPPQRDDVVWPRYLFVALSSFQSFTLSLLLSISSRRKTWRWW